MRWNRAARFSPCPARRSIPRAKGANRLIREGATLTESAEDMLAVLRADAGRGFREPEPAMPSAPGRRRVLEAEADRVRAAVEEALGPRPGGDRRTDPPDSAPRPPRS